MLISTAQLALHLSDPSWVIFDCRHDLGDTTKGARQYAESHLPGAHFAPTDTELSGAKSGFNGRHPLPPPEAFGAFLARHGVNESSTVVAYDDVGGQFAARLWWMARWIGIARAGLLDGGFPKWVAEGRPITAEVPRPAASALSVRVRSRGLWTAADVQARLDDPRALIVDARTPERYRGEAEPIDPVAGHIPGAANRFYKANLRPDLTFRPAAELKQEFLALLDGRRPEHIGHQCGSGITACANLFAMEYAGLTGSNLYAGSWSEWVSDPARPVAKG